MLFRFVFGCRWSQRQHQGSCIYIAATPARRKVRLLFVTRGFAAVYPRSPLRQARISALHNSPRCITSWHLYIHYKTYRYSI